MRLRIKGQAAGRAQGTFVEVDFLVVISISCSKILFLVEFTNLTLVKGAYEHFGFTTFSLREQDCKQ